MRVLAVLLLVSVSITGEAVAATKHARHHPVAAAKKELARYGRDFKSMAIAPVHWDRQSWTHFGEGVAAVAIVLRRIVR